MRLVFRSSVGVFLALGLAAAVEAQHSLQLTTLSFDDANQNGAIDCGESVTLLLGVFDNSATPGQTVTGRLTAPSASPVRWSFQPGSVKAIPGLSGHCALFSILTGNGPSDGFATIDYSCTAGDPPNDDSYAIGFELTGVYTGPSGQIQVSARDERFTPEPAVRAGDKRGARGQGVGEGDAGRGGVAGVGGGERIDDGFARGGAGRRDGLGHDEIRGAGQDRRRVGRGVASAGWTCGATCTLSLGSLAPGASASRTLAVRIPSPAPQGLTSLTNNACVATTTPGDPTANNCASVSSPVNAAPRLDLQKTLASGTPTSGATLAYTLTVTNLGDRDAGAVTLSETVPPNSTFSAAAAAASSPGWSCSGAAPGSTCSLTIPSLAGNGGSASRTFAIVLSSPFPPNTSLTNTACATTSGAAQVCDDITVQSGAPNLTIAKTLQSGTATPGGTVVYLLSVQNTGTAASLPTTLTETLPDHTSFNASSSSPGWSCAGATCTLNLPSLAAGASTSRTFAVTLADPLPAGVTSLRNVACLDLPAGPDLCDDLEIPTQAAPVLSILKEHVSGSAQPGSLVTYRITVGNSGNQAAANLAITDFVPDHTTLATAATHPDWICPGTAAGTLCTWTIASLAPGNSLNRDLAVTVNPDAPTSGLLTNAACLSPAGQACSSVDLPRSGPPEPPMVSIEKSFDGPPLTAGALLTFELAVTNQGTAPVSGLTLTETVPLHSTFQPIASSPGWVCTAPAAGSSCTLPIPSLAPGTTPFTFTVRAADPLPQGVTQIANSACIQTASGTDCDDSSTPLQQALEADLVDLVDDANANQTLDLGEHLAYVLTVTNPSSGAALDVVITLPLDPHLALVPGSVVTSAGTVVSGNGPTDSVAVVQVPSLGPGETVTVTLDSIAHDLAGVSEVASQANVSGSNIADEPSNDPDTDVDDDPTRTPVRLNRSVLDIPTLDHLGVAALVLLLALAAFFALKRKKDLQTV